MIQLDPTPIKQAPINIIMAGQSNMVGYGNLSELPNFPEAFKIKMVKGSSLIAGAEPTHSGGYASCGLAFAGEFNREVNLIPVAVGGTSISQWQKGGSLYSNMISKASVVGDIDGMIFYQGEADCNSLSNANNWDERFTSFVSDLRADLGNIPVVFAQLATKPAGATGRPYFNNLKASQANVSISDVSMIVTEDLAIQSNDVHLVTSSLITVGERFAAAMNNLI